jgi:hypothetical protein
MTNAGIETVVGIQPRFRSSEKQFRDMCAAHINFAYEPTYSYPRRCRRHIRGLSPLCDAGCDPRSLRCLHFMSVRKFARGR